MKQSPKPNNSDTAVAEMRDGWLDDSGDLPRMHWARQDTPFWAGLPAKLRDAVGSWHPRRKGLVILGGTGTGKTAAIVARLHRTRRVAQARPSVLPRFVWSTEARLSRARRVHPLGAGEAPLVRRAQRTPVLIVDELGPAPDVELLHATILDERYQRGRPTTVTSGLTLREMATRYGDAFVRRLLQHAELVDLHGVSS